ncbi:snake venom 5'-nucleotidase-like [Pollicipes pollicipes]|uniref:snake venom 5'-nucleotidase-like n=1 Tax=Pollicipes pollicipes TaxID=41117 RepID=UPI001884C86B|nr:snake venom 5'-nucleotidase-like [Pollicipes pollicipes]
MNNLFITTLSLLVLAVASTSALSWREKLKMPILSIFHQNDIHSHYDRVLSSGDPCAPSYNGTCYGGFAAAVDYVKKSKAKAGLLNVNPGDFFQGHIFYTLFGWRMAADIVSQMPYDALGLGIQELFSGLDSLLFFMRRIGPKFVCTNADFSQLNRSVQDELNTLCPRSRVINVSVMHSEQPLPVGILSYTEPNMVVDASSYGLTFTNPAKAIKTEATRLSTRMVSALVVLSCAGLKRDLEMARKVPLVDVVIGGRSHALLWPGVWQPFIPDTPDDPTDHASGVYPQVVKRVDLKRNVSSTALVVQAYKHGKYMGGIDIAFDDDGKVREWWPTITLLGPDLQEDSGVVKVLDEYNRRLDVKRSQVVGQTLVTLEGSREACRRKECNFGNMFADAVLWASQRQEFKLTKPVSIALINSGSMRRTMPPTNITLHMLLQALPYENTITIVNITGRTLLEVLETSVSGIEETHGGFLQVSGVRATYNIARPIGSRLLSVEVLCSYCSVLRFAPVQQDKFYEVAVTSFMADGGDHYTMIRDSRMSQRSKNMLDVDIILEYFKNFSKVYPRVEERSF